MGSEHPNFEPQPSEALLAGLGNLAPHQTLGPYELLAPVARGGMAVVWAALDRRTSKRVALKTMLPSLSADPRFERMFLAEARLASKITHPNVCAVGDAGEDRGQLYLVMEWIEGDSLAALVSDGKHGSVPYGVAARIAHDVARGLHAAHELAGTVHRDVSPQNILVGFDGRAMIADFGVAKAAEGDERLTQSGYQKGKMRYMCPEQVYCEEVDRRCDVFALGVVLYEATTGVHPFASATSVGVLARIADAAPVARPSLVLPDYPPELEKIAMKALEKDADARYATAEDLADALAAAMASLAACEPADVAAFVESRGSERAMRRAEAIGDAMASRGSLPMPLRSTARTSAPTSATVAPVSAAASARGRMQTIAALAVAAAVVVLGTTAAVGGFGARVAARSAGEGEALAATIAPAPEGPAPELASSGPIAITASAASPAEPLPASTSASPARVAARGTEATRPSATPCASASAAPRASASAASSARRRPADLDLLKSRE